MHDLPKFSVVCRCGACSVVFWLHAFPSIYASIVVSFEEQPAAADFMVLLLC